MGYLRRRDDRLPSSTDLVHVDDPLADHDFQLALYCCYELHYRGFALDGDFEWDPELLRFRRQLEGRFEDALRSPARPIRRGGTVTEDLAAIIATDDDEPSLSAHMAEFGTLEELRDFAMHRSLYQLKEADAHSWAIPRFAGPARAALIEIQMDEYGNGVPGASHAELFATTMRCLGLDPTYGRYVDDVGAPTLATNNLVSMFGLHRRLLPALLGHLAVFEMTSVVPMSRYASACERLGVDAAARRFYDVHVAADAHHGPLAASVMASGFVEDRPESRSTLLWGARAVVEVERRFSADRFASWRAARPVVSSLPAVA
jgi:hypothetical protein